MQQTPRTARGDTGFCRTPLLILDSYGYTTWCTIYWVLLAAYVVCGFGIVHRLSIASAALDKGILPYYSNTRTVLVSAPWNENFHFSSTISPPHIDGNLPSSAFER
eukprot:COSAG02_NODE_14115_length_1306_cov_1.711332_2_plen_105_part_01